jgi:hypothetical protein
MLTNEYTSDTCINTIHVYAYNPDKGDQVSLCMRYMHVTKVSFKLGGINGVPVI